MILVTGGAGYIGSTLIQELTQDTYPIRVLDNLMYTGESILPSLDLIEFVNGDIRDADTCIDALDGIDTVVHLAAIVGEKACAKDEILARETNLYATRQLWELARDKGVDRFIFASTCSNYGRSEMATEKDELNPLGLYAETKVEAEKWILEQNELNMFTTILRFATAFGTSSRMRWDLLINQFVLDAYLNKKLSVYNPDAQRPYCHVKDIARAIVLMVNYYTADLYNNDVFNVGGYNRTKIQLAEQVKTLQPEIVIETQSTNGGRDYAVDFSKIRKKRYRTTTSPEWGIRELVRAVPLYDNLLDRKWVNG